MPAGFTDKNVTHWQTVAIASPKNWTGAAATTEYVNMGKASRARIVIHTGAWAAGTAAVTLKEATAADGSDAQALEFDWMYTNDAAATSPVKVKTAVTSDTFDVDTADSIYEIEVHQDEMTEGFNYLNVSIASPGANNDFYGVTMSLELQMPGAAGSQENTVV